jgi:cation transport ATPase
MVIIRLFFIMAESIFRGGLAFLEQVGVYDVVLPFLLTFTLVYALLEKTKILGVQRDNFDKGDTTEYAKRNLNSMVALVIAFFVIASSKLVELINKTVSQVFILLLLATMFLLVAGTFHKEGQFSITNKKYQGFFMWSSFVAIILIFLNAMGWLELLYNFLKVYWAGEAVSAIIFLVAIGIFIMIVTSGGSKKKEENNENNDNNE